MISRAGRGSPQCPALAFFAWLQCGLQRPSSAGAGSPKHPIRSLLSGNAKPALAKDKPAGQAGPCDITKARLIAETAKEVSQPNSCHHPHKSGQMA